MTLSLPPHVQLLQMLSGYWVSQCLSVVAKLGVADHLASGAQSCEILAQLTDTHEPSLYRVLRALASVGIFTETQPRTFALTPLSEYLRGDVPLSQRSTAIMLGEKEHYESWSELLYSVQTGQQAFKKRFGVEVFDYFAQHPEAAKVFEQSMNDFSRPETAAILDAYDFSGFKTIVDVGGGYGEMLATILQHTPQAQGILFDEAYVIQDCLPTLASHGVADRCQAVEGSFFEFVPPGGDAYLLKHILHDWDDESCLKILSHCRTNLAPNGKLLVCEAVIPPGDQPSGAKFLDINMLVMCHGGKERTQEEFETLFSQAGFTLSRIVSTREDICVVEGVIADE
ncbi:MAG: methyltransferase [Prochlorotrichaceae cyanobacterium]